MSNTRYQVYSVITGQSFGIYSGTSMLSAWCAMVRDAGYFARMVKGGVKTTAPIELHFTDCGFTELPALRRTVR